MTGSKSAKRAFSPAPSKGKRAPAKAKQQKEQVRPLIVQMIAKQMAKLAAQRQILTQSDQAGMASGVEPSPKG